MSKQVADVRIEQLPPAELDRIRGIDRSETVASVYIREGDELQRVESRLEIPAWNDGEIAHMKARLARKLAGGGVLLGALDGDELVGAAVLGGELVGVSPNQLELAFLYVDNNHRGRRIGAALLDEVCRIAQGRGARGLCISASDTESAIGFYLKHGSRLARQIDLGIAAENEPTDIQLTLDLP
jgi:ribosomal protein S18 acetylase RimI-like enzyme